MSHYSRSVIIISILLVFVGVYLYMSRPNSETFINSPYQSSKELDKYYNGSTVGIEDYLIDNMTCHPSCCGDQWPVPFDGLTSGEIEKCIENRGKAGPFVRTSYSCGNGINGTGCPCVNKEAYKFLVNRGQNSHTIDSVEPTFLIRNDIVTPDDQLTPFEAIQVKKSMYSDDRTINDLDLRRSTTDLTNVQSSGSAIQPKYKQLEKIY